MNLFGWDLVYAASVDVVNRKFMQEAKLRAQSFQYAFSSSGTDMQVHISGVFGGWSISSNQSTKLIWLRLPICNFKMEFAPERLIEHVFFPRVQDNFKNAANADFRIDPNYLSIKNIVKVQLPDQQLEDGSVKEVFLEPGNFSLSQYQAMLEAFHLSLKDGKLSLHAQTKTAITPHIYAHSTQDHSYTIELYSKPDGSQSLKYVECGEPVILNSTSQDGGVGIGEMVGTIIAGVILALLTILTDGLVLVLVVIIGGLLVGLIASASEIVQLIGTDDAPNVDLLLLNFTDPIRWTDQKDFTLTSASLNGPLQLGGNFII